jgi:hypothetical protein
MWRIGGGHGRLFAALTGFYLVLYAAAGAVFREKSVGRSTFSIAISLSIVAAIAVYVLLTASRSQ